MNEIEVTLGDDEWMLCQLIGRSRSLINRASKTKDGKQGEQNGPDADVSGFAAEYAFAKHHNVCPDFGLSIRSGSADMIVKGKKIDVKSTNRTNGCLVCTLKENTDVDVYVLAITADLPKIRFVGFARSAQLRDKQNIKDLGWGPGYALPQHALTSFAA